MYTTAYSNPNSLINRDTAAIGAANKTLDIAAYCMDDADIVAAIRAAAARGVIVRLYHDRTELEAQAKGDVTLTGKPLAVLMNVPGITIKVKHSSILMHLKSYLVDGITLRDGSSNFSPEGEIQQDNSLTLTDDPTACAAFLSKFETMWARPDNLTVAQAVQSRATSPSSVFYPAGRTRPAKYR